MRSLGLVCPLGNSYALLRTLVRSCGLYYALRLFLALFRTSMICTELSCAVRNSYVFMLYSGIMRSW